MKIIGTNQSNELPDLVRLGLSAMFLEIQDFLDTGMFVEVVASVRVAEFKTDGLRHADEISKPHVMRAVA